MYKRVDPFKFQLATTYCIHLTARINECVQTQNRPHMGNPLTHFIGPASLKDI